MEASPSLVIFHKPPHCGQNPAKGPPIGSLPSQRNDYRLKLQGKKKGNRTSRAPSTSFDAYINHHPEPSGPADERAQPGATVTRIISAPTSATLKTDRSHRLALNPTAACAVGIFYSELME